MNFLKHILLNQLILIPAVQRWAMKRHQTGRNGNAQEIQAIFDQISEGVHFEGLAVLELGPGQTPGILQKIRQSGAKKIVAADIVCYPEIQAAEIEFVQFDGKSLPLESETFDLIYSWSVFEHVRHPELMATECARLLKKGGRVIHSIDLVDHFYYTSGEQTKIFHCLKYPEWLWNAMTWNRSNYVNRLRASQWLSLFQSLGLTMVEWKPDIFKPAEEWYRQGKLPYLNQLSLTDATTRSIYFVALK